MHPSTPFVTLLLVDFPFVTCITMFSHLLLFCFWRMSLFMVALYLSWILNSATSTLLFLRLQTHQPLLPHCPLLFVLSWEAYFKIWDLSLPSQLHDVFKLHVLNLSPRSLVEKKKLQIYIEHYKHEAKVKIEFVTFFRETWEVNSFFPPLLVFISWAAWKDRELKRAWAKSNPESKK